MITTLGLFLTIAESMRFDLQSGHTKCVSEDINNSAITVGKYNVVNPNEGYPLPDTHKLNVRVISQVHSLKPIYKKKKIVLLNLYIFAFFVYIWVCICNCISGFVSMYFDKNKFKKSNFFILERYLIVEKLPLDLLGTLVQC